MGAQKEKSVQNIKNAGFQKLTCIFAGNILEYIEFEGET